MKNLKSYKLFESFEKNFILDLKDICLELQDDGYTTSVKIAEDDYVRVRIQKKISGFSDAWYYFNVSDTLECVKRIVDFIKMNNYDYDIFARFPDRDPLSLFKVNELGDKIHKSSAMKLDGFIKKMNSKIMGVYGKASYIIIEIYKK